MTDILGNHADNADDATVWISDPSLREACKCINEDMIREEVVQKVEHVDSSW